jgi:O-antigen ligase
MIFPFFLAVAEIFERRWIERRWAIPIAIFGMAAIFGTYSRQVWVSLPLGLFVFALVRLPKRVAVATFAAGVMLVVGLAQVPAIRDRAFTSMGVEDRLSIWKVNIDFFKHRPLTGVGWHHNLQMGVGWHKEFRPDVLHPFIGHAHNNFLECLGALGLIGALAYLFWTYVSIRQAFRAGAGFVAGWVVFHLNGLTQVNLWESKVMHSMMWSVSLAIALRILLRKETRGRVVR